jgi:hypothetical protein
MGTVLGILLIFGLGSAPLARAHDPITTKLAWSREISRLISARCMGCHQAGGAAPFRSPPTRRSGPRRWQFAK